ncbi:MAG: hypothetical protein KDD52_03240 [Bdellovibrionales bacterium]|nr:hypothetical protein [Bdellovibrionales bacterium]
MKTKLFLGVAWAAAFLGVFAGQAHAQIDIVVEDGIEGAVFNPRAPIHQKISTNQEQMRKTQEQWFEVKDADGNLIVELSMKEGSIEYKECQTACSTAVSVEVKDYNYISGVVAREIVFRDISQSEYILFSAYKHGDLPNYSNQKQAKAEKIMGKSSWMIRNNDGALSFDYDNQGTGVSISIR